MPHRFVTGFALAFTAVLSAAPSPHLAASPHDDPGGIDIVVGDHLLPRYPYAGRWYVEAHKGREYAIRVRNPFGVRAAVALTVDGLNTIDATRTSASAARKWVIGPYETITIHGWQTSGTEARRFEFVTEGDAYATALGRASDLGLISAVFFRERTSTAVEPQSERSGQQSPAAPSASGANAEKSSNARDVNRQELAATGMGRATGHVVTHLRLDLESTPAHTVNVRYEFRPELVKLGILPAVRVADPLARRERARGFEPEFSPVVPRRR